MKKLILISETDSTNAEVRRRLPVPHGFGLMARSQTQGCGRQGRAWRSLDGDLAASFWLAQVGDPLTALPLVAGVAVLDALRHMPGGDQLAARCKWPNDIRVQGRKLVGILAGYQHESRGVILGIGVNLAGTAADFADLTQQGRLITSFRLETGRVLPPETLFAGIALHLARRLRQWRRHGFTPLREEWLDRCDHLGAPVSVHCPDGSLVRGVTTGIGPSGELLLDCGGQPRTLLCGDVEA